MSLNDIEKAIQSNAKMFNEVFAKSRLKLENSPEAIRLSYTRFIEEIGIAYAGTTFGNYKTSKANEGQSKLVDDLEEYVESSIMSGSLPDGGVVLVGKSGTGKDHLATAIGKMAILKGFSCRYVRAQELYKKFRDSMDSGKSVSTTDIERSHFLILSDPIPARRELSGFNIEILFNLAESRAAIGFPTIVTLNADSEEDARVRMTPPLFDRFANRSIVAYCGWNTYRKPKKLKKQNLRTD